MAECLMTNCRRQAPADAAMCNLHRDQKAVAWDVVAAKNKEIERLRAALKAVLKNCQVAAPGPHWRWDDEYYAAFDQARAALSPIRESDNE